MRKSRKAAGLPRRGQWWNNTSEHDEPAAEENGRIAAELRRIGRPIGKIDILIAAIALSLGATTVVSADNDLTVVPGVSVENLSAP